jgi:hypothetical protein
LIPVLLRQLRPRIVALLFIGCMFYLAEPAFHSHDVEPTSIEEILAPTLISLSAANYAGLAVTILLAGFIGNDRRRGYYRLQFSHPTRPLAFYALRWALSLAIAMSLAMLFLMLGQLVAWGEVRVGLQFTAQAFTFAMIYAGIAAFFSALLEKGDLAATVAIFFVAAFWIEAVQSWTNQPFTPGLRRLISFILPPHTAATDVYNALLSGGVAWGAAAYALGYGLFWLILAGLLVKYREWP